MNLSAIFLPSKTVRSNSFLRKTWCRRLIKWEEKTIRSPLLTHFLPLLLFSLSLMIWTAGQFISFFRRPRFTRRQSQLSSHVALGSAVSRDTFYLYAAWRNSCLSFELIDKVEQKINLAHTRIGSTNRSFMDTPPFSRVFKKIRKKRVLVISSMESSFP